MDDDDECPKGGEHHWKFNSGNPVCLKCGEFMPGEPRVVLPAVQNEDGTFSVVGIASAGPHREKDGYCARDGDPWPCAAAIVGKP